MIEIQLIAILVFICTYILIIDERIHRAVCAMAGASVLIILGILDWNGVLQHTDFGTIFLLLGMMIIVNTAQKSGLFEYLAIITAKAAKGIPIRVLILFAILTAICSALLDNVTTVLLITPMLLTVTRIMQQNPIPFLLTEIFASNIGGTATLIGDPPNIMIASASGLTFNEFLMHMGPIAAVNMVAMMLIILLIYGKRLTVSLDHQADITAAITSLDEKAAIVDPKLFRKSLIVIFGVVILFFLHSSLGLEPAEVALIGASILLFWSRASPILIFEKVEWPALFFFGGLFVLVGGLVETGVISQLAEWLLQYVTDTRTAIFVIASFSAVASGIVDNIPLTAAMIPLIQNMASSSAAIDEYPLWWALSLGACLGGNMTSVGASANVVVLGLLDREGHSISFVDFFKIGSIIMVVTVTIGIIMLYMMFPEAAPW